MLFFQILNDLFLLCMRLARVVFVRSYVGLEVGKLGHVRLALFSKLLFKLGVFNTEVLCFGILM